MVFYASQVKSASCYIVMKSFTTLHRYNIRSRKINLAEVIIIYLLLGSVILLCNLWTPPLADDYFYRLRLSTVDGTPGSVMERATQWSHLFETLSLQWRADNFRLGNILTRIFLFLEQGRGWIFALANTLVFLLMVGCLAKLVFKRQTPFSVLVTTAFFLIFCPAFGPTCLWLAGSFNYLWGGCMLSLFLVLFQQCERRQTHRKWYIFGCIVTSFLASWFHEAIAAPLIGALLCYFILHKCSKRYILLYIPLAVCALLAVLTSMSGRVTISFIGALLGSVFATALTSGPYALAVLILAFCFRRKIKRCWKSLIIWLTVLEWLLYAYSGAKASWGIAGPAYFPHFSLMICSLYLLRKVLLRSPKITVIGSGAFASVSLALTTINSHDLYQCHQSILQAVQRGETSVVIDKISRREEVPWMFLRCAPWDPYCFIYPFFPYYYQCQPVMVVFNRLVEDKSIYSQLPEARENTIQTMRCGDFVIFRLPHPWLYAGGRRGKISEATTQDGKTCYWYRLQSPLLLDKLRYRIRKGAPLYSWGLDYHNGFHYVLLEMPEEAHCETMHLRIVNRDNMEARVISVPVTGPAEVNVEDPQFIEEVTPQSLKLPWLN